MPLYRVNVQCLRIFYVMQSRTTTVTHSYLKTSVFISYYNRCSNWQPSSVILASKRRIYSSPSSCASFQTFIFERDCTPLQCFHKGCIQSKQQLILSRLMHSIHCGSAVFPYQALESRKAQETLICCAGPHKIRKH
jgi:hypothetical protein